MIVLHSRLGRYVTYAALSLLVLILAAVVVVVLGRPNDPAKTGSPRAGCLDSGSSPVVQVRPPGATFPVAIVGDSYSSAGVSSAGWVRKLASDKIWSLTVVAAGGTGFVNGGPCGDQQFISRVGAVASINPRLLIIEGGLNDSSYNPEIVRQEVAQTLADLRSIPSIVVVGPANAPARPAVVSVDRAIREAVIGAGRQYVSTLSWPLQFGQDGVHPTSEGYQIYGNLLREAIR